MDINIYMDSTVANFALLLGIITVVSTAAIIHSVAYNYKLFERRVITKPMWIDDIHNTKINKKETNHV